jgi:hypothetical protein
MKILGCLINFNQDFFSSFLNKSQCIDQLPIFSFNRSVYYQIPKEDVCKFREIFMKIKNINEENNRNAENLLRIYLLELFYTVLNEISDSTENINITNQKNLILNSKNW